MIVIVVVCMIVIVMLMPVIVVAGLAVVVMSAAFMGVAVLVMVFADCFAREGVLIENCSECNIAALGSVNDSKAVQAAQLGYNRLGFIGGDKVKLVENEDIGKSDLLFAFLVLDVFTDVLGVDGGDYSIESECFGDVFIDHEGLNNRCGVGNASGLDDNVVELTATGNQIRQCAHQVSVDGAAQAAVAHFENGLIAFDQQSIVDADFTEFVLDDRYAFSVGTVEHVIEQGSFARAEEASDDSHRDASGLSDHSFPFAVSCERK